MRCVVSCGSTSFLWLAIFFEALLRGSMIHSVITKPRYLKQLNKMYGSLTANPALTMSLSCLCLCTLHDDTGRWLRQLTFKNEVSTTIVKSWTFITLTWSSESEKITTLIFIMQRPAVLTLTISRTIRWSKKIFKKRSGHLSGWSANEGSTALRYPSDKGSV